MSPIPDQLRDEFIGWMQAHDFDDMSDGAWWATLEQAAEEFCNRYCSKVDVYDATIWYVEKGSK